MSATVAAIVVYGLSGRGMAQMTHDEMAGAAAELCLLLATAVVLCGGAQARGAPARTRRRRSSDVRRRAAKLSARCSGASVARRAAALSGLILLSGPRG
jgi:hypothetical protein